MTEMVHGTTSGSDGEAILSRWWRTTDLWTMTCIFLLFSIGLLLGFAASPPLAEKNGFAPFHYVERQIVFGALSLSTMIIMSMMSVDLVRRLANRLTKSTDIIDMIIIVDNDSAPKTICLST